MSSSPCPRCKRLFRPAVLARHAGLCPRCAGAAEDEDESDEEDHGRPAVRRKKRKTSRVRASGKAVGLWLWGILGVEALVAVVLFLVMQAWGKQDPILGVYLLALIVAGWLASRVVFHFDSGGVSGLSRIEIFLGMVATIFRRPQIFLTFALAAAYTAAGLTFVTPRPAGGGGAGGGADQQPQGEQGSSEPGLRAHWGFDEGRGDKAADSGKHRLEARLHGCQWVPGVRGTALQLNGTSDYVELSDSNALNFAENAPFTIAAWVKTSKADGYVLSFRIDQDKTFDLLNIFVAGGKLAAWVRRQGNPWMPTAVATAGPINDGRWHHFAVRRMADGEVTLHLDGTFQGKLTNPDQTRGKLVTNKRALGVEATSSISPRLEGCIDELRIYGEALPEKDLAELAAQR